MAEKKIDGVEYRVTPMLAYKAIVLQSRLMKVVGGAVDKLPAVLAGYKSTDPEARAKSDAAAIAAFTEIFRQSDPDEIATLIKDVVELAEVRQASGSYTSVDMDREFSGGKLANLVPVTVFVIREQFGSFFSAVLVSGTQK